jgi:hypothetical protein
MTLSLNIRQNGPEINLSVSRAQRTFGPGADNQLIAGLGTDAIADSTGTNYLRLRLFTSIVVDCPEEPASIVIDQAILDILEHYPFSSIQELTRLTWIPTTTAHRHLTQSLVFVVKHLP